MDNDIKAVPPTNDAVSEQPAELPQADIPPTQPLPVQPPAPADLPKAEQAAETPLPAAPESTKHHKASSDAKPPKPVVSHRSGNGLAIAATVVIVLGLAALATYAYLQTR